MSKKNKKSAEIRDLVSLTKQAVSLAKERREQALSEEELADVSGGAPFSRPILMGYQMQ